MNHLVFLDAEAGEHEKILSGVKSMIVKDFDPALPTAQRVRLGDSLIFLRDNDECALRVKAAVVRVLLFTNRLDQDLSQSLKEMQPKLQLTEDQNNYWPTRKQALLVEFESAHKIGVIQIPSNRIADRSDWIAFEDFNQVVREVVSWERRTVKPEPGKGVSDVREERRSDHDRED